MEINYIYQRISHHSDHSGYDQLVKYVPSNRIAKNSIFSLLDLLPEGILAQIRKSAGKWYNSNALKWELQNIFSYLTKNNNVFHFLYGEDTFHYSGYLNLRRSNKFVVTYHNPPQKFDHIIPNKNHLKYIDAVIVVCAKQVEYFKAWVEEKKIHLVHHGIDTEYFHPVKKEGEAKEKQCLFVGTHLRDFETLKRVISKVNCINSSIKFSIITDRASLGGYNELKNTRILEKVCENELLALYRESDVVLLPIIDCTANNTLLEAMACGVPVITNDVGGVRDYINNQCVILIKPGNVDLMAAQLVELLGNDNLREDMSHKARENSLQFDWKIIAGRMKEIYATLFNVGL